MTTFKIGKSYSMTSVCNHDCVWTFEIMNRTAKTISIDVDGKIVSRHIYIYDDCECVRPFGSYSMAPVLRAERVA